MLNQTDSLHVLHAVFAYGAQIYVAFVYLYFCLIKQNIYATAARSSNVAATAMLGGMERVELQDAVHSLSVRHVDWHLRSSVAQKLGVGTAENVVDVVVLGESIANGSILFHFDSVYQDNSVKTYRPIEIHD